MWCACRYELAYIESRAAGVARGQRVWQLAFGSGFKFNSCVLVANKRVQEAHTAWKGFEPEVRMIGCLDSSCFLVACSFLVCKSCGSLPPSTCGSSECLHAVI